jgi:hypothetical protein
MALQIYKKIEQSAKSLDRTSAPTEIEVSTLNAINQRFVDFFKGKHLQ